MSAPARLMLDIEGLVLNADDRRRLMHPTTAAVILFARNFASRQQVSDLVQSIKALRPELLVAVDHEGGRVQRFVTDGMTRLPAMQALGRRWHGSDAAGPAEAARAAHAVGYVMARELRELGVDFSFAPVLDLDYGQSAVIGDRAFAADARIVTSLARALIGGLLQGGMAHCGKHFPGHGFAVADSHVAVPEDERTLSAIEQADMAPYRWLGNALLAVMPAHVIYRQVDALPAGFSAIWLQDILRGQLGFEGAIFSDDLCMAGAAVAGDIQARARAALSAGCDLVLVCNRPDQVDRLLEDFAYPADGRSQARLFALAGRPARPERRLADDPAYHTARQLVQQLGG